MTKLGALFGSASTVTVVAGGVAAVAVATTVGFLVMRDTPGPAPAPQTPVAAETGIGPTAPAEPEVSPTADTQPMTAALPQDAAPGADDTAQRADTADTTVTSEPDTPPLPPVTDPDPDPVAPRFDVVRVEADGTALIAGRAAPDATVTILLDGQDLVVAQADASGSFVAILTLDPSSQPRSLSLLSDLPGADAISGEETVLVTPFGMEDAPVAMANVAPEAGAQSPAPPVTPPSDPGADPAAPGNGVPVAPDEPAAPSEPAAAITQADPAATATATESATAQPATEPVDTPDTGLAAAPQAPAEPAQAPQQATVAEAPSDPDPAPTPAPTPRDHADTPDAPETPVVVAQTAPTVPEAAPAAPSVPQPDTTVAASTPDTDPQAPAAPQPSAPTVLLADADGVRVLQGPGTPPNAQTEVRLDAISYDSEGEVVLAGRGAPDASLRVLLNNQPIRMGEVGPGGAWQLDLPDVDPGTYTLRVELLTDDGQVATDVETPFLREDPARLAAAPMRVAEGVSVITVQPGFTLWGIAETNFGDGVLYVSIFDENRSQIRNPDLIYPGQIFELPDLPRVPMTP